MLLVEHRLPFGRHDDAEVVNGHFGHAGQVLRAHLGRHRIALGHREVGHLGVETGLLLKLALRGGREVLARLDDAGDHVPVAIDRTVQHQERRVAPHVDGDLAFRPAQSDPLKNCT